MSNFRVARTRLNKLQKVMAFVSMIDSITSLPAEFITAIEIVSL